jgi:ribosome maturation factor RimP
MRFAGRYMNDSLRKKVIAFAEQVADSQGVELFELDLLGRGRLLLRISIDKEGGVTLDDCEHFSRALSAVLDVEDPFAGPYTLEVSSPGIDRPLRSLQEFEKNKGKLVRVITTEEMDNQKFFIGRIAGTSGSGVTIIVNNREVAVPFEKIAKAKLEIEL